MVEAVFLDRDGTLIKEVQYLSIPEQIQLLPRAAAAVRRLNQMRIKTYLVTNQSAIARGLITEFDLLVIHARLVQILKQEQAFLDGLYYCPHYPGGKIAQYAINCNCRKPAPGLLQKAAREHQHNLGNCFMVGDRLSDIGAGNHAGCHTALIQTGYGKREVQNLSHPPFVPDVVVRDLYHLTQIICSDR